MRGWLLLLALWTLLPSLTVGGAAAWLAVSRSRTAAEARLLDTARALALALDRQVEVFVSALVALAASPALDGEAADFAALRAQARAVAAHLGAPVLLRGPGPEFRELLNTQWSPDASPRALPLPAHSSVPQVFATGKPAVSPLLRPAAGLPLTAPVLVPVIRQGEVRYVFGALLYPEQISRILRSQTGGEDDSIIATVTDSAETVAARSEEPNAVLGLARPPRQADPTGQSGIISGRSLRDGQSIRIAYARLHAAPGWTLWVTQPQATLDAAWVQPAIALGVGALLALTLATAGAVWIARRIAGPLRQLTRRAEASSATAGAGPLLASIAPTRVRELERLRVALDGADLGLRRRLQAEREATAALRDSEARFRAMADNIPQLAWMTRPDGWIFWYNQRWYDYTGATPEQMRGWGWKQVHPDYLARVTAHFRQRVLEGVPWEDTFPMRRHDGAWRWFLSRAMPIRNEAGRVVMWFGTNTDITEQREAEAALAASEERLRLAIDSTGLAMMDADLGSGVAVASPNLFAMRGMPVPPGGHTTLAAIRATLHPEDRDRVLQETEQAAREGRPCRITHRIRRADTEEVRWIEMISRLRTEADGRRRLVSVQIDMTDRIAAEEQRLMLAREVDHRAKNVLAVVQALLALTPSASPEARRFAEAVSGRVAALARAHALLARERWVGAELRTLVEEELAAYAEGRQEAVVLSGRELRLAPGLAQPLSLVLHELATNAAKYGALSNAAGRVAVSWTVSPDRRLELRWEETGGPPVAGPPERPGFGSRLVAQTVKHQLHGRVRFEWQPSGLQCYIDLPLPLDPAEA